MPLHTAHSNHFTRCQTVAHRLILTKSFTPVWLQCDCFFQLECCGPNGSSINTRVTSSPLMLSADYLNGYLLSNHIQRNCQFLAFLQSASFLISLFHFVGSHHPSRHLPWTSLLPYTLSHRPRIKALIILQNIVDPSSL